MYNKKKGLVLSLLGIIGLVVITAGVTFAFFNYAREGSTENTLKTGSISFIYEEVEANGSGISIVDALPMADSNGKSQSGAGKVFNFNVQSKNGNFDIPYTVTARMSSDSNLSQSAVKVYLTEVSGGTEIALTEEIYGDLANYTNAPVNTVEKIIYTDTVAAGTTNNYNKDFRLRMWIPDTIDFSPVKDENGNDVYPYNGKTFTITVNVYANAEVVNTPIQPTVMNSNTALSIGDAVTAIDGSKWHVLEASVAGTDTVVLLSDYNLNTDGSYNTECGRDINSTYICSNVASDPDNVNVYDESDINSVGYFVKSTYTPLVTNALPGTTNVTLPKAEQIALADGKTFTEAPLTFANTNTWYTTTNYWTKDERSGYTNIALIVSGSSNYIRWSYVDNETAYGVRPVITTLKTNLLAE